MCIYLLVDGKCVCIANRNVLGGGVHVYIISSRGKYVYFGIRNVLRVGMYFILSVEGECVYIADENVYRGGIYVYMINRWEMCMYC